MRETRCQRYVMTYWWEERLRRADRGQRRHRHEQLSRRAMRPEQPGRFPRVRLWAEREARAGIVTAAVVRVALIGGPLPLARAGADRHPALAAPVGDLAALS